MGACTCCNVCWYPPTSVIRDELLKLAENASLVKHVRRVSPEGLKLLDASVYECISFIILSYSKNSQKSSTHRCGSTRGRREQLWGLLLQYSVIRDRPMQISVFLHVHPVIHGGKIQNEPCHMLEVESLDPFQVYMQIAQIFKIDPKTASA